MVSATRQAQVWDTGLRQEVHGDEVVSWPTIEERMTVSRVVLPQVSASSYICHNTNLINVTRDRYAVALRSGWIENRIKFVDCVYVGAMDPYSPSS